MLNYDINWFFSGLETLRFVQPVCRNTWDDDAGVFGPPLHGLVSGVGHGVQVRRVFVQLPAAVRVDGVFAVDFHLSVGVDGHDHFPDVGVDPALLEPEPPQTKTGLLSL